MGFKDVDEVIDRDMVLPIRGKKYAIPPADWQTGLWLQSVTSIAALAQNKGGREPTEAELEALVLDDGEEREYMARILGPAFEQMKADSVDWETIKLAGQTATIRAMSGLDDAEKFWNSGGRPKARKAPSDRQPRKTTSGRRASTGSKTPRR